MRHLRYSTALVLAFLLSACSSHSVSPTSTLGGSRVTPFLQQSGGQQWQMLPNYLGYTVAGSDGHLWYGDYFNGTFIRVDPSSPGPAAQIFASPTHISADVLGPDGNVWWCGTGFVGKITPAGVATTYAIPSNICYGIASGPDGALWSTWGTTIYRVTTDGQVSSYSTPAFAFYIVGSRENGLVWFTEIKSRPGRYVAIASIDPSTGVIAEYRLKGTLDSHFLASINSGVDGGIYVDDLNRQSIVSVKAGVVRYFRIGPTDGSQTSQQDVRDIWLSTGSGLNDHGLEHWNIKSHKLTSVGLVPSGTTYSPILGPDMNVWFSGGVYINRVITVTPSTANIPVGQNQALTVNETKCNCIFSVSVADPSIASASPVVNGQFTITGISPGSTTVTVSDQHQNGFAVAISVQ